MNPDDLDCLSNCMRYIFDVQRMQQIETHYDHILEKSFEGLFRFIHIVPGFFSGYNMYAIRKPGRKDELLREYFRSVDEKLVSNKIVPSTAICIKPCAMMFFHMFGVIRLSFLEYGCLRRSSSVGGSVANAREARVSMIKLTQSI